MIKLTLIIHKPVGRLHRRWTSDREYTIVRKGVHVQMRPISDLCKTHRMGLQPPRNLSTILQAVREICVINMWTLTRHPDLLRLRVLLKVTKKEDDERLWVCMFLYLYFSCPCHYNPKCDHVPFWRRIKYQSKKRKKEEAERTWRHQRTSIGMVK